MKKTDLNYFEEIMKVPRESGKEEKIANYFNDVDINQNEPMEIVCAEHLQDNFDLLKLPPSKAPPGVKSSV